MSCPNSLFLKGRIYYYTRMTNSEIHTPRGDFRSYYQQGRRAIQAQVDLTK